jgi:hypothetical protein
LASDTEFYRTLWIPNISRWGYFTNGQPRLSAGEMDLIVQKKINSSSEKSIINANLQILFKTTMGDEILDLIGIKYIVVPCYDVKNDPEFLINYKSRESYLKIIKASPFLERVDLGISCPEVFLNSNSINRISLINYAAVKEKTTDRKIYHSEYLKYERVGPYHYKVKISNLKKLIHLRFSDSFNSEWKIAPGKFSWIDVLLGRQTVLPSELHISDEMGFNDFKLDPVDLSSKGLGRANVNGGVDFDFTLFFAPQANVWLGSIISVIIFICCFFYVLVSSLYFVSRMFMIKSPRHP